MGETNKTNESVFPEDGLSSTEVNRQLKKIRQELESRDISRNLGLLYTSPEHIALKAHQYFLDQNPNHLGNWSTPQSKPFATQKLERDAISSIINLHGGSLTEWEGYITSGGTEGNLYCAWIGRKYLEQYTSTEKICLIRTKLTHYSVAKSASVINVPEYLTPLSHATWSVDVKGLDGTIRSLYGKGYRGFLLSLTLGYTLTGTADDIKEVCNMLHSLEVALKGVSIYIWVDAASNGLILPFLDTKFHLLAIPRIQAVVIDFHKFGGVPYSAGVVLYRSKYRLLIEQNIEYLSQTDSTLLGSRPGTAAVAIWAVIHSLGKRGFGRMITGQLENKSAFVNVIRQFDPNAEVITDQKSLSCGVIFHSLKNSKLPESIEKKFWLFPGEIRGLFQEEPTRIFLLYKFYFLPHLKRSVIDEFFRDLDLA